MRYQGFQRNKEGFFKSDCTVRALTTVSGLDYYQVFEYLTLEGRKANSGWDIANWLKRQEGCALGKQFISVDQISLSGVYLCWNQGHAWAVKNGILFDAWEHSPRANRIFLVVPDEGPQLCDKKLASAKRIAESIHGD